MIAFKGCLGSKNSIEELYFVWRFMSDNTLKEITEGQLLTFPEFHIETEAKVDFP